MADSRLGLSAGADSPGTPPPHRHRIRKWAVRALALVVCLAGLIVVAHAPPFREWLLGRVASYVGHRYDLVIQASGLDYNLLTLSASLDTCRMATSGDPARPIVEASGVTMVLGPAALRGRIDIRSLEADSLAVSIRETASSGSSAPFSMPAFTVGRLDIRRLAVEHADGSNRLVVRGGSLRMDGRGPGHLEGPFTVEGVSFRNDTVAVGADRVSGVARVDGQALVLAPASATVGATRLAFDGRIAFTGPDAGYALGADGELPLDLLHAWLPAVAGGEGSLRVRARLTGPLGDPRAMLRLESSGLTWAALALPAASADVVVGRAGIDIARLDVASGGSRVAASGQVSFEQDADSAVRLEWTGATPAFVAGLLRQRWPVTPVLRSVGTAHLTWRGLVPDASTFGGRIDTTLTGRSADSATAKTGRMRITASPARWEIDAEQAVEGDSRILLDAVVVPSADRLAESPLSGTLQLAADDSRLALRHLERMGIPVPDLPASIDALPLTIDATLAGTISSPVLSGTATSSGLAVSGLEGIDLQTGFSATLDTLTLDRFRARDRYGNALDADARLSFADQSTAGTVSVRAASLDELAQLLPEGWRAAGTFEASGSWSGTIRAPEASLRLTSRDIVLNRSAPGSLEATARVSGGRLDVEGVLPGLSAQVDGRVALATPFPFEASVVLAAADLSRLAALAPGQARLPELSGTASARISLAGTMDDPETRSARIRLEAMDAKLDGRPITLAAPAEITWAPSALSVEALSIRSGGAAVTIDGHVDRTDTGVLSATLDAPVADLLDWAPSEGVRSRLSVDGRFRFEVRAAGPIGSASLDGRGDVAVETLHLDGLALAEKIRAAVNLRAGRIDVPRVTGSVLGGPLDAALAVPASWITQYLPGVFAAPTEPDRGASFRGTVTVDVGEVLARLQPDESRRASGTVTVSVNATATEPAPDAVEATAAVAASQLAVGDSPVTVSTPVVAELRKGRVRIASAELRARAAVFALEGYADLVAPYDTNLRLTASGPLAFLSSVLPGRGSGRFSADLTLGGPEGSREASGTLALENAALIIPAFRLALTDWSGRFDLTPEALTTVDVRGQINGGTAELRGRLPFGQSDEVRSTLALSVRDAFLEVVKGFKSQADADLDMRPDAGGLVIGGSVTVSSGAYREPITAMAALFGNDGASTDAAEREPGALDRVSLDVRLLARSPVVVENSLGRLDLMPDMRLVGTLAEPALSGALNALDGGQLTLAGRRYRVLESQALFTPRDGWLPRVNLSAETQVGEYTVNLRVLGPVDQLETSATSTPPLSERDLQSLIVTGRTADTESDDDQQFAMEAVSSEILGFAGQMVGLDSLQLGRADFDIGASDVNPATRLTVMKSLNPRLRIVVSENLDNNKLTWIIVADSLRGYELRFSQRDNKEEVFEFRHEVEFGAGMSARRREPGRARPPRPTVSSVVFSGASDLPAAALQDAVRTRVGRPFEIEQWQRDRERLEALFRERGFAVARVTPRRTVAQDPSGERVDVEYAIAQGPRTILDLSGSPVPDWVRRDLLLAWSESVLPEFFRDEAERVLRQHFADRNRLQPEIDIAFDRPAAGVERTRIRLAEGPAVQSKRVVFDGHRAVTEAEIGAAAERERALARAWVDASALAASVAGLYRARGFFGAAVKPQPVVIEHGQATLRVVIDEGPLARVGSVRVDGVAAVRLDEVRAAARLRPGSVFLPSAARDAAERVRRWYEDHGYRSVNVRPARDIAGDGTVSVALTVVEGPQSVVAGVRVVGAESTRPETVADAITLKPGTPAGAAAVEATRNRLYGLGVFRSADVHFEPVGGPAGTADDRTPVEAVVSLSEVKRFQLRYGVQLSNAHGPLLADFRSGIGVAADIRDRNFLGRGVTLGASGRYERDLQTVRGLVFLPRYLDQRLESNVFATWRNERSTQDDFTLIDTRQDVTFEQRLHLPGSTELSWGYSYYWRDFGLSFGRTAERLDIGGTLSSVQASLVIDRRDNVFDARRGWFHSQNLQLGLEALGSDTPYTRYLVRQFAYVPVGPLVLASGVRWGTLSRVGDTPPLTILDLFFDAGGGQTVRGYAQDSLSALSLFEIPVGGTELLILNQEVRFPIFKWFSGAAFIDAGNTFGSLSDVSLAGLAVGAGFGIRIQTPLAPFRIDLGFPVGPFRESRYRWHFSIGQMF